MSHARVHSLAGYGFEVPDAEVARAFYSSFGLQPKEHGQALALGCADVASPSVLVLQGAPGSVKRLHHISFFVDAQDLASFEERLYALGTPISTPSFAALRPGLWFQDPWGTWFNLTPRTAADEVHAAPRSPEFDRIDRHLWQELPREAQPRKLGHMLLFTQDFARAEAYLSEALGLRTTDRAVGKVSFMAGGEGVRDHHCFGLINSTHRGFQHSSFYVDSFDQIGFGGWQMREAGFADQFGLGRHALASNLFLYIRDPWGSWVEYYSDMDKISETWTTRDWNQLPYIWGPKWSPEFWGTEMNANLEPR
ncbi:VOC family protein [Variovorax sp. GB1P17]